MADLAADAARLARLSAALQTRLPRADEWLQDMTPDGYPAGTSGSSPIGSSEPTSPVLNAIIATPTLIVDGEQRDLRGLRSELEAWLAMSAQAALAALRICDAIPRHPTGQQAATIAYEQKHVRCEGWGPTYATCERYSVHPGIVVDGSTWKLCHPCYLTMWRQTDPGQTGRQTRKATA